jgi:hypothetical protein
MTPLRKPKIVEVGVHVLDLHVKHNFDTIAFEIISHIDVQISLVVNYWTIGDSPARECHRKSAAGRCLDSTSNGLRLFHLSNRRRRAKVSPRAHPSWRTECTTTVGTRTQLRTRRLESRLHSFRGYENLTKPMKMQNSCMTSV